MAEAKPNLQAMFENGTTLITIQPYTAHKGCPEGIEPLGYMAAVE
jgi:hypothetical protein